MFSVGSRLAVSVIRILRGKVSAPKNMWGIVRSQYYLRLHKDSGKLG
jgi:hypothetical protein